MNRWRSNRHWLAWLAALVIGLAALAPTVSRALADAPDAAAVSAGWVEVCTPSGMLWIQPDGGTAFDHEEDGGPRLPALDYCALCLLSADRLGPPPAPDAVATALRRDLSQRAPDPAALAPDRAPVSLAGRPRGPPPHAPQPLAA